MLFTNISITITSQHKQKKKGEKKYFQSDHDLFYSFYHEIILATQLISKWTRLCYNLFALPQIDHKHINIPLS